VGGGIGGGGGVWGGGGGGGYSTNSAQNYLVSITEDEIWVERFNRHQQVENRITLCSDLYTIVYQLLGGQ